MGFHFTETKLLYNRYLKGFLGGGGVSLLQTVGNNTFFVRSNTNLAKVVIVLVIN